MSSIQRVARRVRDIATAVEREGWAAALERARSRFGRRVDFVLLRWQAGEALGEASWEDGYRWSEGIRDLLERERARGRDLPREFFVDRTHGGRRFYVVYRGDDPAHIHWVFRRGDYSRFFTLGEGAAEINYIYTFPAHRGRGLLRRAMASTAAALAREGVTRVCTAVGESNVDCLRGLRGSGLTEFARSRSRFSFVKKVPV